MNLVILAVVGAILVFDLAIIFGIGLFVRSRKSMKALNHAQLQLQSIKFDKPLPIHETLEVVSNLLLHHFIEKWKDNATLKEIRLMKVGDAFLILQASEITVRRKIREIQAYAVLIAYFFIGSTLYRAVDLANAHNLTWRAILTSITEHPWGHIESLSVILLAVTLMRLYGELDRAREIIETAKSGKNL